MTVPTPHPVVQYVQAFPDAPSTPGHLAALAAHGIAVPPQAVPAGPPVAYAVPVEQAPPVLATTAPAPLEVPRDRYKRPLIEQFDEAGKPLGPKPYTRASTLGDALEDTYNLEKWKLRQTLLGVLAEPDLMLQVGAYRDDKGELDNVAQKALDAAKSGARADIGTALHKLTEALDAGRDPGPVPARFVADLEAYRKVTAGWEYLAAETFCVCDELAVAGTFDRLRLYRKTKRSKPVARIVDLKTGASVDYSWLKFSVQLAVYAHGKAYDIATGQRGPLAVLPDGTEVEVDLRVAEVVWLPAGEGRAEVFEVDIASGWTAAQLATSVRKLRSQAKGWAKRAVAEEVPVTLLALVEEAPTVEALVGLWQTRGAEFTAETQAAADARWALLSQGLVGATA